jgi:hypothetical protein
VELEELSSRLARLEAERDILDLLNRYAHVVDYGQRAEWVDLFVPDGRFEVRYINRPELNRSLAGREAFQEYIAGDARVESRHRQHAVVNPQVVLDGERATMTSFLICVEAPLDVGPRFVSLGRYVDELTRCPDGRWRFAERICLIEGRYDYNDGEAVRDRELALKASRPK